MVFLDKTIRKPDFPATEQPQAPLVNSGGVMRKLLQNIRLVSEANVDKKKQQMVTTTTDYPKTYTKNKLFTPLYIEDDYRILNLEDTAKLLQTFQIAAMEYDYNTNDLAKEYLLKARYREDRDNFFNSFNIESYAFM